MLQSMTGQGQAQLSGELGSIAVEVRTVNNRGLKLVTRLAEPLSKFEAKVEAVVRKHLTRGSVNLNVRWRRHASVSNYQVNTVFVETLYRQLSDLQSRLETSAPIDLAQLAAIPGVVEECNQDDIDQESLWHFTEDAVTQALVDLNAMRATEGASMGNSLSDDLVGLRRRLSNIESLAPQVVEGYRDRLESRIVELLNARGLEIAKVDILKELQVFADRTDISEEVTRLKSHLDLFDETIANEQSSGRRLDFIIQEMFRETNTIGSKANDALIAKYVVDMKCAIERMRELVQNIE